MLDVEDFKFMDTYDQYILASVMIPKDDGFTRELFIIMKQDSDGNIIG